MRLCCHSYEQYVISSSITFAVIAWSSFFISRAAAPARVSLGVILFLVISAQTNSQLAALPKGTSGVWLLDFLGTTKMFVLYSMLEYGMLRGSLISGAETPYLQQAAALV